MRRTPTVYLALAVVWATLLVWQGVEHSRVRQSARVALVNRAKDISDTLVLVLRSQRRFGGLISKERLESALNSLVKPGDLNAVALLNDAGDVVASAGAAMDVEARSLAPSAVRWDKQTVSLMNLVDLGTNVTSEAEGPNPTIVLPRNGMFSPFGTNRPAPRPDAPPAAQAGPGAPPTDRSLDGNTNAPPRDRRSRGEGRPRFGRPPWMSEADYKAMLQKQGVHSFVLVLSTQLVRELSARDLWLRCIIGALASVAVVGLGLAWRNRERTSELEVRLVRAAELNTRLKEMNLAAAGLAHETKNPLNIIRGLAQVLAREESAPPQTREHARQMLDQADRVTAQLNEFINYSRPREVRRAPVALAAVVAEVKRALNYDLEDKAVRLRVAEDLPTIVADEALLRQALFNLLLNAVQALPREGSIEVAAGRLPTGVTLEVRDDGPGVAPEHRQDVFKPYFTTNEKGTGLGLAVVQQIVLAHGWEIECAANAPRGAIFRISHLQPATNVRSAAG